MGKIGWAPTPTCSPHSQLGCNLPQIFRTHADLFQSMQASPQHSSQELTASTTNGTDLPFVHELLQQMPKRNGLLGIVSDMKTMLSSAIADLREDLRSVTTKLMEVEPSIRKPSLSSIRCLHAIISNSMKCKDMLKTWIIEVGSRVRVIRFSGPAGVGWIHQEI